MLIVHCLHLIRRRIDARPDIDQFVQMAERQC